MTPARDTRSSHPTHDAPVVNDGWRELTTLAAALYEYLKPKYNIPPRNELIDHLGCTNDQLSDALKELSTEGYLPTLHQYQQHYPRGFGDQRQLETTWRALTLEERQRAYAAIDAFALRHRYAYRMEQLTQHAERFLFLRSWEKNAAREYDISYRTDNHNRLSYNSFTGEQLTLRSMLEATPDPDPDAAPPARDADEILRANWERDKDDPSSPLFLSRLFRDHEGRLCVMKVVETPIGRQLRTEIRQELEQEIAAWRISTWAAPTASVEAAISDWYRNELEARLRERVAGLSRRTIDEALDEAIAKGA